MFNACRIKLYRNDEWIFLRLNGPLPPPSDRMSSAEFWKRMTHFPISGPFYVRENSVSKGFDSGKFVLANPKWPEAFWNYSANGELNFISSGRWTSGRLKHGETELIFNPVLTLYEARLTTRGVEPMSRTLTGRAIVKSGGNMQMLRQGSELNWEWRSWDWTADKE